MPHDSSDTAGTDRDEPEDHHRPEEPPHRGRAPALDREQQHDDQGGDRDDELFQPRLDDLDAFHRGKHGDRGGDHAVTEEQRGTEDAEPGQHRRDTPVLGPTQASKERNQGHDPALAVIVGAHHK